MFRLIGISVVALAAFASVAQAQDDSIIRKSVAVSYGDLDVSQDAGARVMLARLGKAATEACGFSPVFYSYYDMAPNAAVSAFETCRKNAIDSAVASIQSSALHHIYAESTGHEPTVVAGR